jgi:hypothetical protein
MLPFPGRWLILAASVPTGRCAVRNGGEALQNEIGDDEADGAVQHDMEVGDAVTVHYSPPGSEVFGSSEVFGAPMVCAWRGAGIGVARNGASCGGGVILMRGRME